MHEAAAKTPGDRNIALLTNLAVSFSSAGLTVEAVKTEMSESPYNSSSSSSTDTLVALETNLNNCASNIQIFASANYCINN